MADDARKKELAKRKKKQAQKEKKAEKNAGNGANPFNLTDRALQIKKRKKALQDLLIETE